MPHGPDIFRHNAFNMLHALVVGITQAKAMEVGLRFALDVGIRNVVVECDALAVFNAVQGFAAPSSSILFIVDSILQQAR